MVGGVSAKPDACSQVYCTDVQDSGRSRYRFTELMLFKMGYAYEQATHHRKPPKSAPPLHNER